MSRNYLRSLNPFKIFSILRERKRRFKLAGEEEIPQEYSVNALARKLHPDRQFVKIARVETFGPDCKRFTFIPCQEKGTSQLAYFAAGSYISVFVEIDGRQISRAYSLSSSPDESLPVSDGGNSVYQDGSYQIAVKAVKGGEVSNFILNKWKENDIVEISAPEASFNYVPLRDAKTVIGIAGGSGITPFLSFSRAILQKNEDFNLILLYGSRNFDQILFKDEFDKLAQECPKIKVVYVLSDENPGISDKSDGGQNLVSYEKGFITADLIKKYAPSDQPYSVFVCGPQPMYDFLDGEFEKLKLIKKYIRKDMYGEIHDAQKQKDYPGCNLDEVEIKVRICGEVTIVKGSPRDTILQTLEKNGVCVPARCRSGECGWCHSNLISGQIFVPQKMEYRRSADITYGAIHPCCTFPLSDLEIEIPLSK
ncbi:MAG: 2Fe-2S iron-sulfur cluster binding domain-containing protein [Treponema sp.]|nr:2Fe-2S iron-sulfur cluster binding domain-containing protein [Treponema sp.]